MNIVLNIFWLLTFFFFFFFFLSLSFFSFSFSSPVGNTVMETPMVKNDTNPVWRYKTQLLIHDPGFDSFMCHVFGYIFFVFLI